MNFRDWYTDTMDIWRVSEVKDGALTRHERKQVAAGIPCRVYQMGDPDGGDRCPCGAGSLAAVR